MKIVFNLILERKNVRSGNRGEGGLYDFSYEYVFGENHGSRRQGLQEYLPPTTLLGFINY